jgi:hypothetical protein
MCASLIFRMCFLPQQPPGGKIGQRQGPRLVLLRTLTLADSAQTCRRGSRSGGRRWANYSTDSKAIMQKSRLKRPCTNQNRRIARSQPKAGRPSESEEFLSVLRLVLPAGLWSVGVAEPRRGGPSSEPNWAQVGVHLWCGEGEPSSWGAPRGAARVRWDPALGPQNRKQDETHALRAGPRASVFIRYVLISRAKW